MCVVILQGVVPSLRILPSKASEFSDYSNEGAVGAAGAGGLQAQQQQQQQQDRHAHNGGGARVGQVRFEVVRPIELWCMRP
jgi:hypothetical protein